MKRALALALALVCSPALADSVGTCTTGKVCVVTKVYVTGVTDATQPQYSFAIDQRTGYYRSAANETSISAGGVQILKVNSSGLTLVGTAGVTADHFAASSNGNTTTPAFGIGNYGMFKNSSGSLDFAVAGSNVLSFGAASGNISAAAGWYLSLSGANTFDTLRLTDSTNAKTWYFRNNADTLELRSNSTSRMVTFSGPNFALTGSDANATLNLDGSNGAMLQYGSTGTVKCTSTGCQWLSNAGTGTFTLGPSGTGVVPVKVQGNSGQAANLQEWNVNGAAAVASLDANGRPLFGQGTDAQFGVVPAATTGGTGIGSMQWFERQLAPHPGNTRRIGFGTLTTNSDTAFTYSAMAALTVTGTASSSTGDSTRLLLNWATGAVSGNTGGLGGPFTATKFDYQPAFAAEVRTDSVSTSQRIWVGLTSADLSGVATLAGTNAIRYCAFRYDTGLADTNWQACSSDGTTASCTDTGVAFATSTTFQLYVDAARATTCEFAINGTLKVSKSTNRPTGTTAIGPQVEITTLTTAARNLLAGRLSVEQN